MGCGSSAPVVPEPVREGKAASPPPIKRPSDSEVASLKQAVKVAQDKIDTFTTPLNEAQARVNRETVEYADLELREHNAEAAAKRAAETLRITAALERQLHDEALAQARREAFAKTEYEFRAEILAEKDNLLLFANDFVAKAKLFLDHKSELELKARHEHEEQIKEQNAAKSKSISTAEEVVRSEANLKFAREIRTKAQSDDEAASQALIKARSWADVEGKEAAGTAELATAEEKETNDSTERAKAATAIKLIAMEEARKIAALEAESKAALDTNVALMITLKSNLEIKLKEVSDVESKVKISTFTRQKTEETLKIKVEAEAKTMRELEGKKKELPDLLARLQARQKELAEAKAKSQAAMDATGKLENDSQTKSIALLRCKGRVDHQKEVVNDYKGVADDKKGDPAAAARVEQEMRELKECETAFQNAESASKMAQKLFDDSAAVTDGLKKTTMAAARAEAIAQMEYDESLEMQNLMTDRLKRDSEAKANFEKELRTVIAAAASSQSEFETKTQMVVEIKKDIETKRVLILTLEAKFNETSVARAKQDSIVKGRTTEEEKALEWLKKQTGESTIARSRADAEAKEAAEAASKISAMDQAKKATLKLVEEKLAEELRLKLVLDTCLQARSDAAQNLKTQESITAETLLRWRDSQLQTEKATNEFNIKIKSQEEALALRDVNKRGCEEAKRIWDEELAKLDDLNAKWRAAQKANSDAEQDEFSCAIAEARANAEVSVQLRVLKEFEAKLEAILKQLKKVQETHAHAKVAYELAESLRVQGLELAVTGQTVVQQAQSSSSSAIQTSSSLSVSSVTVSQQSSSSVSTKRTRTTMRD